MQSAVCLKQVTYEILELVLVSIFPEMRDVVLDMHEKMRAQPLWDGCLSVFAIVIIPIIQTVSWIPATLYILSLAKDWQVTNLASRR